MANRTMRLVGWIAAWAALGGTALAQTRPAGRPCISERQSEALVAYVLPTLIPAMAVRCLPQLGAQSYLARNAQRLAARFGPGSVAAWPEARGAVERVARIRIPADGIEATLAQGALGAGVSATIAAAFDGANCSAVDRLMADLEPLPPANFASAMALFLELGIARNERIPFRVCAAPRAAG